ncbi:N(G),N(G)-dimethylarginine dimethylaminohydrolase 1-like isoform X1 [Acanthaster planci]|uniref:N(G),N(G)-dimethylarginine dimethylaminohydrolase 1-like isoform X1 n=1 Tax=Acanthaster planci TaxID=133434 RepID=A0A8B7ZW65_ACAPL|nr:N(G),N(G)-dimethylarginine dimethylaminohydrolase 1-like isoform X1 [Acanthaster planci]
MENMKSSSGKHSHSNRPFMYATGIVSRLPESLANKDQTAGTKGAGTEDGEDGGFNLELARRQHEKFILTLRKLKVDLSELDADEDRPFCCYLEHMAVVRDGVALIARPGGRLEEEAQVDEIRRILRDDLRQQIYEIEDPNATLDGGDVLFTGEEFFVGISKRTNSQGANALAKAFPNYPVSSIKVADHLHLKSMMSMAAPGILAVGSSPAAQSALKQILEKSDYDYCTLTLPDDAAANCVYVRGYLLHCTKQEYPNSYKIFEERFPNDVRIPIPNSELHKVDGALTCRCILVQKPL